MIILLIGLLGALIGAVVAEYTVGWTTYSYWVGHRIFNEEALIFVAIGFVVGILIGYFAQKLLTTIKESKDGKTISNADEIGKLKILLDNGTITQEEFDEKKKQLLNI